MLKKKEHMGQQLSEALQQTMDLHGLWDAQHVSQERAVILRKTRRRHLFDKPRPLQPRTPPCPKNLLRTCRNGLFTSPGCRDSEGIQSSVHPQIVVFNWWVLSLIRVGPKVGIPWTRTKSRKHWTALESIRAGMHARTPPNASQLRNST